MTIIRSITLVALLTAMPSLNAQVTIDSVPSPIVAQEASSAGRADLGSFPNLRLTVNGGASVDPAIDCDDNQCYVVWEDDRDGNWEIYYTVVNRAGFPKFAAVNVSNSSGKSLNPAVSVDASGNVFIAWTEGGEKGDATVAVRDGDGGLVLSPTVFASPNCRNVELSAFGDGLCNVVYESSNIIVKFYIYWARVDISGTRVCGPRLMSNWELWDFVKNPDIESRPNGECWTIWGDYQSGYRDIRLAWQLYDCADSSMYLIHDSATNVGYPEIEITGGTTWIGFEDRLDGDYVYRNFLGEDNTCVVAPSTVTGDARYPSLASDGANGFVAWEHQVNPASVYITEFYGCNVLAEVKVSDGAGDAREPELYAYSGGEAGLSLVWQDNRHGHWDIYFSSNALVGSTNLKLVQPYYTQVSQAWGTGYTAQYPQQEVEYIGAVITNQGPEDATDVLVRFEVNSTVVAEETIATIAANETVLLDIPWTIPGTVSEDNSITVTVDPDNTILEYNEDDNDTTETVSFYTTVTPDDSPTPGEFFDLRTDTYGQFSNEGWEINESDLDHIVADYLEPSLDDPGATETFNALRGLVMIALGAGGHCYGMSATSIWYYLDEYLKPTGYASTETFDMPKETAVIEKIYEYQAKQILELLGWILGKIGPFFELTSLEDLQRMLKDDHKPKVLMIDNHALVTYKLVKTDHRWQVSLYEVNTMFGPGTDVHIDDHYLLYDEQSDLCYWGRVNLDYANMLAEPESYPMGFPFRSINEVGDFAFFNPRRVLPDFFASELRKLLTSIVGVFDDLDLSWLIVRSPVETLVENGTGQRIGFEGGTLINEIPAAEVDTIYGIEVFRLPHNDEYQARMLATGTGYVHVSMMIPTADSTVEVISFDSLSVDQLWQADLDFGSSTPTPNLSVDHDGDGTVDTTLAPSFTDLMSPGCCLRRGDINHDGGATLDISDLMYFIDFMFTGGPAPVCHEEADTNADGDPTLDIADLMYLIDYMFTEGPVLLPCP